MQQTGDTVAFALVLCLPVAVWVVSRPWVWSRITARLTPVGTRLWRQVVVDDEPDEATLQRWALERLERLRADLARVRRILLDDAWMSATRQVGNRLAYERLVAGGWTSPRAAMRRWASASLSPPAVAVAALALSWSTMPMTLDGRPPRTAHPVTG